MVIGQKSRIEAEQCGQEGLQEEHNDPSCGYEGGVIDTVQFSTMGFDGLLDELHAFYVSLTLGATVLDKFLDIVA